jgi:hypothetical protein
MRTAFATFCCAALLCGCGRPPPYGLRVLNRSTNDLALLHISSDAGDVWFPPIASAASSYEGMYGAPSPDITIWPRSHMLWVDQPARMPSKDVVVSFLTPSSVGPVTNRVRVVLSSADREAVRGSHGSFVFTVNADRTIATSVSPGSRL